MITLYNPHIDDFLAEPPHFRFVKRRPLKKYGFFINCEIANSGKLRVLIDGTISAFIPYPYFNLLPKSLRRIITSLEFAWWKKINRIEGLVEEVITPGDENQEVLLVFSYKSAIGAFKQRKATFSRYKAVVFHLSHYFIDTSEKSENIAQLDNAWLAGDSDISENQYFRHFFQWYNKQFLVLPFAVADRFRNIRLINERQQRCIATGTFHDLTQEVPAAKYRDYLSVAKQSTYHPLRKELYDRSTEISDLGECKISPYRPLDKTFKIMKLLRHFSVSQKHYFSIDIVELYNQYQCAVVGEELSGFPALGAFEAMACGCVLIGVPEAYTGTGMIQGKHFVPSNGFVASVLQAIKQVAGTEEGMRMSKSGQDFVEANCRPTEVHAKWIASLNAVLSADGFAATAALPLDTTVCVE